MYIFQQVMSADGEPQILNFVNSGPLKETLKSLNLLSIFHNPAAEAKNDSSFLHCLQHVKN